MSINAISSQPSVSAPTTQATSPQAPVFALELDKASAEPPKPGAKSLGVMALTSADINARLALLEEQRPRMEAAAQQFHAWTDYVGKSIAAKSDQPYGQVFKNGQVVATLYNSGAMSGPGATLIDWGQPADMKGPELAQWRAEQIAQAYGGTIVSQDTAQSQSAWAAGQADDQPIMHFRAWQAANGFAPAVDTRPYYGRPAS
jgi:hypothetical protein